MAKKQLEFANFVCRFGQKSVLVDQLERVVLPAFSIDREKSSAKTRLFLHDVVVTEHSKNEHVIGGRIVKDTILESEKLYDKQTRKLEDSTNSLRSSPSSFFALVVETHRLIFVKEHRGSPTLRTFENLMRRFLLEAYIEAYGKSPSRKSTAEPEPDRPSPPTLEIVPMMSESSLGAFLDRFDIIQSLSVRVAETNNELDNSDLLDNVRESHRRMQSTKTELSYKSTSEGLNKTEVAAELEAMGKGTGYGHVKGKDALGHPIEGNNENFGVKSNIDSLPDRVPAAIEVVMAEYNLLEQSGAVNGGNAEETVRRKVKLVYDSLEYDV